VYSGPFQIAFDANELGGEITPNWSDNLPEFAQLSKGEDFFFFFLLQSKNPKI
jgi:hypothetical protein